MSSHIFSGCSGSTTLHTGIYLRLISSIKRIISHKLNSEITEGIVPRSTNKVEGVIDLNFERARGRVPLCSRWMYGCRYVGQGVGCGETKSLSRRQGKKGIKNQTKRKKRIKKKAGVGNQSCRPTPTVCYVNIVNSGWSQFTYFPLAGFSPTDLMFGRLLFRPRTFSPLLFSWGGSLENSLFHNEQMTTP